MAPFIPVAPKKRLAETTDRPKSKPLPLDQPTRLGFGEYYHPTLFNKAALRAQIGFIEKIEEFAPEVLVDLAEFVHPVYEQLRNVVPDSALLSLNAESLRNLAANGRNEFAALSKALELWIAKWHLNADWIRSTALATLFNWTGRVIDGKQLRFGVAPYSAADPLKPDEQFFSFSDYGWRVTSETKSAFVARVRAEFEKIFGGYVSRIENRVEKEGWKHTPEIRKTEKDSDPFRHFEWLVRWQCQGWSKAKIARKYGFGNRRNAKSVKNSAVIADSSTRASEKSTYTAESDRRRQAGWRTVHDGVEKAAILLDLPLRRKKIAGKNNLSQ